MKFKTPSGRIRSISLDKYLIDWDKNSLSKGQFELKQFLRQFWSTDYVCEELFLIGTRLRLDFFNKTKMIAIEFDGEQHDKFVPFFTDNNRCKYLSQKQRDNKKELWCQINNILFVRIKPIDMKDISKEWFNNKEIMI